MEIDSIVSILFGITGNIDHQWNVYYVGVLAFAGWMISRKSPTNTNTKIMMTTAAFLFMIAQLWTLETYYTIMEIYIDEFNHLIDQTEFSLGETNDKIKQENDKALIWAKYYWTFHLAVDAIVLVAIWFDWLWCQPRDSAGASD